ncbi:CDP-alcohol phosphatidyltransferase family protein [Wenzhouxiangella marina]|uniref:CDP-alcohol phosphatidyltransferase n=1 Tax=Wenzhouxiangella marina TaxID=1579979 RepID=A0A0K0Y055_9GAMM|nr:CDP-alcohol phosphatidyltransferase family protein [Wenzhouxiangella marina]AKS43295.1 CDP-alcohol phosphatidyltransferase [Wenzhouxiangella marina]MBB6087015.1 phosphatidylglycerophosphate synthase [Wenzhouxiangella marina]
MRPGVMAIRELSIGLVPLALLLWLADLLGQSTALSITVTVGLYLILAALIWQSADDLPRAFGWANRVTLLRAILVSLMAGWLVEQSIFAGGSWLVIGLALFALVLDGIDGRLARRLGQSSDFGARFDMEVDAALILVLSAGLLVGERVGPWVLAIGLMRYAFLLAMAGWPWLAATLPPSFRRKLICVWQVSALMVALIPGLPAPLIVLALASALALLSFSFALDILWLIRRQRRIHQQRWRLS